MRVNSTSTNTPSFRGLYSLQGKTEVLNEVCWYLGKVKKRPETSFDFLDIRNLGSPTLTNEAFWRSLSEEEVSLLKTKGLEIKKIHPEALSETNPSEALDLFVTNGHFSIVQPQMRPMVEDSMNFFLGQTTQMTFNDFSKKALANLNAMEENVSHGKPVTNINFLILKGYLGTLLDLPKVTIIKAEDAFKGIEKGTFDFKEGVFA